MSDLYQKPWQVKNKTIITDCSPWLRVVKDHVQLPNNVEIDDFYRIEMPAYVMVFALTPQQEVPMVAHYKHGPATVSLELPAGYVEAEEKAAPLQTAQRELAEETGYTAANWSELGHFFIDGNRGCGWVYGFLATEAAKTTEQRLEPSELIALKLRPLALVFEDWKSGQVQNIAANAIIGLSLARLEYLRQL